MSGYVHLPTLIAIGTAALVAALAKLYHVLTSPISKLPGTQISKFSGFSWWYSQATGNRVQTQHASHENYGPVVRMSPTDVAISDPAAVRTIFGFAAGYLKSDFYQKFTGTKEGDTVFTMIDPHLHQARRRLLGNNMSESHLRTLEPHIRRLSDLAISRMVDEQKNEGKLDLMRWWFYMTTDVIGDLTFGDSFNMLEHRRDNQYIKDIKLSAKIGGLFAAFPGLRACYSFLPLPSVRETLGSNDRTTGYAKASVERYRTAMESDPASVHDTLFSKIWKENEAGAISEAQLAFESRSYIAAGTDTTAYTLTYLIWELTQHADIQAALRAEIAAVPAEYTSKDLAGLPVLHNVLYETLRLHGPVQQSLPRVVPAAGLNVAGHFLPPGTTVHPQSYTLQRDASIYADPLTFNPARWTAPSKAMNDNFLAFGGGSRVCLGKNLAVMEMNLAVVGLFKAFPGGFKSVEAEGQDMTHTQYFLAGPRGGKCWVAAA